MVFLEERLGKGVPNWRLLSGAVQCLYMETIHCIQVYSVYYTLYTGEQSVYTL